MLRHVWSLLLLLIASSLMVTGTVHAREMTGTLAMDCNGAVHVDGDADQSLGDADSAMPHHHGSCHGPVLNIPASDMVVPSVPLADLHRFHAPDRAPPSRGVEPALRPPAA